MVDEAEAANSASDESSGQVIFAGPASADEDLSFLLEDEEDHVDVEASQDPLAARFFRSGDYPFYEGTERRVSRGRRREG